MQSKKGCIFLNKLLQFTVYYKLALPKVYIFIFMRKSLLSNKNVIKYGIFLTEVKLPKNSHI